MGQEEATALWRETYREIAMEEMLRTVEEAMSQVGETCRRG